MHRRTVLIASLMFAAVAMLVSETPPWRSIMPADTFRSAETRFRFKDGIPIAALR